MPEKKNQNLKIASSFINNIEQMNIYLLSLTNLPSCHETLIIILLLWMMITDDILYKVSISIWKHATCDKYNVKLYYRRHEKCYNISKRTKSTFERFLCIFRSPLSVRGQILIPVFNLVAIELDLDPSRAIRLKQTIELLGLGCMGEGQRSWLGISIFWTYFHCLKFHRIISVMEIKCSLCLKI